MEMNKRAEMVFKGRLTSEVCSGTLDDINRRLNEINKNPNQKLVFMTQPISNDAKYHVIFQTLNQR